jgi:hypothetical protein
MDIAIVHVYMQGVISDSLIAISEVAVTISELVLSVPNNCARPL